MNDIFLASMWAMFLAQWVKVPIWYVKKGVWNWSIVASTGSMPSSHSAFVCALATGVFIVEGGQTSSFAIAMVFALITVHDAIKVRGESGKQAKVINELVSDLGILYKSLNIRESEKREAKLKELIGHTTTEVVGGILFGIGVAIIYFQLNGIV